MWSDLIHGFKKPFRLLPLVIALITLVWILIEAGVFWGLIGIIAGGSVVTSFIYSASAAGESVGHKRFIRDLEINWPQWDKRIQSELQRQQFVISSDFEDIKRIWIVDDSDIRDMLAKYASKHPRISKYTDLSMDDGFIENALVNLKTVDLTRFSF